MNTAQFRKMTASDITLEFEKTCIAQDKFIVHRQSSKYNKSIERLWAMVDELGRRIPDQRSVLRRFYNHPNREVRFQAARHSLAIFPDEARKVLQIISDRDEYPQAANARLALQKLDDGTLIPT